MFSQSLRSDIRYTHWLLCIALGIAVSIAGELPYGGWLQIPVLSLLWWRLSSINTTQFLPNFAGGFLFGLAYFVVGLWWIFISLHDIGGMNAALSVAAVVLLSAYMALFFGLASALGKKLKHRHIFLSSAIMAAAWVLMEYLRGQLFTGFPWVGFAEAQVNGPFAAIAPLLGGLGSTFLVVWASMQLSAWRQSLLRVSIPIGLALVLMLGLSQLRFTEAIGNPISVRLIQGNFEQSLKWNPNAIAQQIRFYSEAIVEQAADLIVIPETAFPLTEKDLPSDVLPQLRAFSQATHSNILLGLIGIIPSQNGQLQYSNRALGLSPSNTSPYYYDKFHLVPFGEFIPPGFQWFVNAFRIPMSDFARGKLMQAPFQIERVGQDPIGAAVTICYEDIFGNELASRIRNSEAPVNLFVNITNLAWFGQSQAPSQQLRLSQMRSIETGLPSIRSTNTGITAVIGPDGRVLQALPQWTQASLSASIQGFTGKTPFVIWGNWPILSLASLLLAFALLHRRRF
ncbi:MAG: apolipoprotein N-acyltransferase [Polynucleobacter sp.]|nr:apolipoprotein N-acyltransferase [Polynucleobacter sp.]